MKKRVLVVTSKLMPEYSGSGLRALTTYNRLTAKYPLEPLFLTGSNQFRLSRSYEYSGVKIFRIAGPFPKDKFKLKAVNRFFHLLNLVIEVVVTIFYLASKKNQIDLVHTFGNGWVIEGATLFSAIFSKPLIREIVCDEKTPFFPIIFQNINRKILKNKPGKLFIPISDRLERLCVSHGIRNYWKRYNPIRKEFFEPMDEKVLNFIRRDYCSFTTEDKLLLSLANFRPSKKADFLVDVISCLPENYKLALIGPLKSENQEFYNKLVEKIKRLNLIERVFLHPKFVENPAPVIAAFDMFLFPSESEGLGTPLLEAMALGKPIVSNIIPGVTDIILEDYPYARLSNLDVNHFAKKILEGFDYMKLAKSENIPEVISNLREENLDRVQYERISELLNSNK